MNLPELWFTKKHKETGVLFKERFTDKNCAYWSDTCLRDLNARAQLRINIWNAALSEWHYEIIGWEINND